LYNSYSGSISYLSKKDQEFEAPNYFANDAKIQKKFDRLTEIIKRRFHDNKMKYSEKGKQKFKSFSRDEEEPRIFVQNNFTYYCTNNPTV
jgi:hypothetical protein